MSQTCSCPCGDSHFSIDSKALVRFYCHCTICQSLYQLPYSDVTAFVVKNMVMPKQQNLNFTHYRRPPALYRGICQSCNRPLVGFLRLAPFFRLAFIPTANIADQTRLPEPSLHIFYHSRVADVADNTPKYSGYWKSEWAISSKVLAGIF